MKKRSRPSLLRYLEQRYADRGPHLGRRRKKPKLPLVYPVMVKRPARRGGKGVIDMTVQQFVALAIFFVMLACVTTSATTFAVIELAGGQGEQGLPGLAGTAGEPGPAGPPGKDGNEASQDMIKRLAAMFAVQQTSVLEGGTNIAFTDLRVDDCVNYVMTGKPDAGACAGFHGTDQ